MKTKILAIILFGVFQTLIAQTVPTNSLRIKDATTLLGKNIPVGTHVYDITNNTISFHMKRNGGPNFASIKWMLIGPKP